jgi:hypothetical protein
MTVLSWVRRAQTVRAVLAVVLATFLPLTSATAACELACALERQAAPQHRSADGHGERHEQAPLKHIGHGSPERAGPCQLSALPFLACAAPPRLPVVVQRDWAVEAGSNPVSQIWPPPEHPPRP